MRIQSTPNQTRWSLAGGLVFELTGLYVLIKHLLTDTPINFLWIAVLLFLMYYTILTVTDLYISFFSSPSWMELRSDRLHLNMPFGENYSLNVSSIASVVRKKWYEIGGFYKVIVSSSDRRLKLYFDTARFENLSEFLRELKKANPSCHIDEALL